MSDMLPDSFNDLLIDLMRDYGEVCAQKGALEEKIQHVARCLARLETAVPSAPTFAQFETIMPSGVDPKIQGISRQGLFLQMLRHAGGRATAAQLVALFAARHVEISVHNLRRLASILRQKKLIKASDDLNFGVYEIADDQHTEANSVVQSE